MRLKGFFGFRAIFWLVVGALMTFRLSSVTSGVWSLVVGFVVSGFLLAFIPSSWSLSTKLGYAAFFLDTLGLTLLSRSVPAIGSEALLLYGLLVFAVTGAEDLRMGVGVAGVVAALYTWLSISPSHGFAFRPIAILHVPLFLVAATACGYLAREARVERAARHAEEYSRGERYQGLFQSNPQPMWVCDLETSRFLDVNDSAVEQYGYLREEFLRLTVKDICPPEEQLVFPRTSLRSKGNKRWTILKHRKKDATLIDVEVKSYPLIFDGRPAELVVATDITDRKQAEEKLRTTNQALQTLIQACPLAIVSLDLNGHVRSWNAAAQRIFGWSELEVLGRPLPIVSETQQNRAQELHARVLRGEQVAGLELCGKRKDGSLLDIILSAAPLYDAAGNIYGTESLVADVSQHKQLQEQFRQAQKMEAVGRLAGGVAHDFNNLLTIITGYSELLSDRLVADGSLHGYADEIKKAGERAASLTRQLLTFSRKQVLSPQLLDLNTIVSNTEKMLRRLIGEDVELRLVKGTDLEYTKADAGQLEQIIMNLVVNSRDAMPHGGKLTIETANVYLDEVYTGSRVDVAPGPYVMLAVTDTGIGMDAQTQARIFEPFFTTKEPGKGTGLGLATVYGIAKQCGGDISVLSKPGFGTTFKIYLPAFSRKNCVRELASGHHARLPRGVETILLVEDEGGVRSLARAILEGQGYTVLEAGRPEEALAICRHHEEHIHLLLTDVVMPEMSGYELAERLAFSRPEMGVLYMSGYTDRAGAASNVVGAPFLSKPFTRDALARKVREVLDTPLKVAC